jgi:hypothetical protein
MLDMTYKTSKKKASKMGRPPLPLALKRTEILSLKVTAVEKARLEQEAVRLGISVGALLMRPWRKGQ